MNIINAIYNLVNHPIVEMVEYYQNRNRANQSGDAFEEYIKDLFADSFDMDETQRLERLNEVFSYLGNNSNPPDAMIRGGDVIEVKKIETNNAALALNSSYPKHTFLSSSSMISCACKEAEEWTEKDVIYAIGVVDKKNNHIKHLSMVYGLDYCASEGCYSRIKNTIKEGVEAIHGVEFSESRELGHINRVDPLGITYMRVRGMWGIENPWKVFNYIYQRDLKKNFTFMCVINNDKWNGFDNTSLITNLHEDGFQIKEVRIKNPDNPARLVDAKLITFSI